MQDIAARASERALVAWLRLAFERSARFLRREAGVDGHGWRLVGEEDPVAIFLRQIAPGGVDVVAERHEDVAQVLSVPCGWPRGDGALANRQRVIGHHGFFGHLIDPAEAVTG